MAHRQKSFFDQDVKVWIAASTYYEGRLTNLTGSPAVAARLGQQ